EAKILPVLSELGIGLTAYGVLSRGLLTRSRPTGPGDLRNHMPRFSRENQEQNLRLVDTLEKMAAELGVRPAQLAIAWVLSRGATIVPVMGARTRAQLEETLGALDVTLSPADLARLEEAVSPAAVAGTRYAEPQLRTMDSER